MDHQKIYNQIIDRAKARGSFLGYKERHHIVPRCLGGANTLDNLVYLTAREHFICHWLLHRANPNERKLAIAFDRMAKGGNTTQPRYIPSSRAIAEAREASSRARAGIKKPSVSAKLKGRLVSEETIQKRAEARKQNGTAEKMSHRMSGKGNPMFGSKRDDRSKLNTLTKSKKCIIDGIVYDGVGIASRALNVHHKTLLNRIRSVNFPNCTWFFD